MATSLARAGFPLVLYNRSPESARSLAAELGATVGDVAAAAVAADVRRGHQHGQRRGRRAGAVRRTGRGQRRASEPGAVALEMSTVPPSVVRGLAAARPGAGRGHPRRARVGQRVAGRDGPAEHHGRWRGRDPGAGTAGARRARGACHPHGCRWAAARPSSCASTPSSSGSTSRWPRRWCSRSAAGVDRAAAYDVFLNSAIAAPFVRYKRAAFVHPESTPVAFSVDARHQGPRPRHRPRDRGRRVDAPGTPRPGPVPGGRGEVPDGGAGDLATVAGHLRR